MNIFKIYAKNIDFYKPRRYNKRVIKIYCFKGVTLMKKLLTVLAAAVIGATSLVGLASCSNNNKSSEKVKLISVDLTNEDYAFAMKGDNTTLQASFNEYLTEIKGNGKFDEIISKYFENNGTKVGYAYAGDGSGENTTGSTGEGKFVVATNAPFSPFEYVENGKIYGVDMEIAAGYAQKHNLELVIKNIDFDSILPSLDAGYADIGMAGMTVTEDRAAYLFTNTYYKAHLNIIVAADNKDFDNCDSVEKVENILKGLSGKKIGYQTGTTAVDYVNQFTNVTGKGYETAAIAVNDIINGNIYAVIVDNAPASAIVKSYNV